MKKILLLAVALFLVGCNEPQWMKEQKLTHEYVSTICINDVRYFKNRVSNGHDVITPMFNVDGTIATCLDEQSMIEYLEDMEYHNE